MVSFKVKCMAGALAAVLVVLFIYKQPTVVPCKDSVKYIESKEEKAFMELHAVVTFPLLTNASRQDGYQQYSLKIIQERMEEYITSLQRILDHQYVSHIHFLYDNSDVVEYVKSRTHHNKGKLIFHKNEGRIVAKSALQFAFGHLLGKLVMITQADVYPVDGLDLVKKEEMSKKKLMYALTRNGRLEKNCDMRSSSTCHPNKYIGSHDTYIFVPMLPFAQKELDAKFTIPSDSNGADNLHIWYFQSVLHYKVLNPCLVIKMYHLHCTRLRKGGRKRYNTKNSTGTAKPTTNLF